MKRRILAILVAANVLLAVSLFMRFTHENAAVAQLRRPPDYILIPGEVTGGSGEVVYMVDTTNGWLGAMTYDDSAHELNTMPPLDLSRVFETASSGNGRAPGEKPPGGRAPAR